MKYFGASFIVAEYFKPNRGFSGFEFNEHLFGRRVLDCDRAHPENIADFLHLPAGGNLAGFPRQLEIGDAGQGRDVRHAVVIDEKVSLVKCLFEELSLEGRFIGIDQRAYDRLRAPYAANRRFITGPVPLVGEGVGRQRDSLSRAVRLKSMPVRKQTFGPQPGNLVRVLTLRHQPNEFLPLPPVQQSCDAFAALHVTNSHALSAISVDEAGQLVDQLFSRTGDDGETMLE